MRLFGWKPLLKRVWVRPTVPVWLIWFLPCPPPTPQNNKPGSASSLHHSDRTTGRSWHTLWPAHTSHLESGDRSRRMKSGYKVWNSYPKERWWKVFLLGFGALIFKHLTLFFKGKLILHMKIGLLFMGSTTQALTLMMSSSVMGDYKFITKSLRLKQVGEFERQMLTKRWSRAALWKV